MNTQARAVVAAPPPLFTRAFVLLTLAHFIQALGFSSQLLLPLYLDHLGATRGQLGLIMAAAAVGGLALRPAAGWALDTLGRRPTLLVGTLVLCGSMALIGWIDQLGALIYVQRLLLGAGVGTLFTAYFTLASDIIPAERRTEGIALFGVSGLLPVGLNAFVGDLGMDAAALQWFFPIIGGLIALSLPLIMLIPEPPRAPGGALTLGEVTSALGRRSLRPVWLAAAIFAGLVATFMAFVTVSAEARGLARPAGLWLTYAGGAVAVRLFGGRLPDRIGPSNMIAPALAFYVVAMLLVASAETDRGFLVAGVLAGLGHGYCFPVLTGQVVGRSPARLRGSALAMFTALWDILSLTASPLAGLIADTFDDRTMFATGALCAVVGLALWVWQEHRHGAAPTPDPSPSSLDQPPSVTGSPKI